MENIIVIGTKNHLMCLLWYGDDDTSIVSKDCAKCETFCLGIPGSLFRKPKWHVVVVLNVENEFIIFLNNYNINPMNMSEHSLFCYFK